MRGQAGSGANQVAGGHGVLVFILQICGASKYQGSLFLGMEG